MGAIRNKKYLDEGEEFKSTLQAFVRLYSFLSQIIDWTDADLEKMYAYGRYLLTKLPYRSGGGTINLDDDVALSSYRNEKTFEGSAALVIGETEAVYGASEVGTGGAKEEHTSALSKIIDIINNRFGTEWTKEDQLLFEQISGDMVSDTTLNEQARANSKDQFKPVFEPVALKAFIDRQSRNEKIVDTFFTNPDVRTMILGALLDDVYMKANVSL